MFELFGTGRHFCSALAIGTSMVLAALSSDVCAGAQTTHYVSSTGRHIAPFSNWSDAATNITVALSVALNGSRVLVTNGTYDAVPTLAITQSVELASVNGPEVTVLDGLGVNRCAFIDHTNALMDGFTVRNGYVLVGFPPTGGAGILLQAGRVQTCIIEDNRVEGDWISGLGGGIWSSGFVSDCIVRSNQCPRGVGGGACIMGQGALVNSLVVDNIADSAAGVFLAGGGSARRCRITGNVGTMGCGGLGALTAASIENCAITGNHGGFGGGVSVDMVRPIMGEPPGVRISNTTICGNDGPGCAGLMIFRVETGHVDVVNSIIYGNAGLNYSNSVGSWNYSYSCTTPFLVGTGNITDDPQLTPSHRLKSTSPCIDAGTSSNAPPTDIEGEARWDQPGQSNIVSIVDIGADEFVDADSDYMADHWENETFGSATNSNGTTDGDNDDLNDLGEYENGTDPADADSDNDFMPDGWEVAHTLNPLTNDAALDPDADTMNNGREYESDTNPQDPESVLALLEIVPQAGGIRIDWKGGRDAWQFLEYRSDLVSTADQWTAIFAVPPPTLITNAIVDLGATNSTLFYRIRAER